MLIFSEALKTTYRSIHQIHNTTARNILNYILKDDKVAASTTFEDQKLL